MGKTVIRNILARPIFDGCARPSLEVGDLVRHSTFGEGVVMECIPTSADQEITVQFSDGVGVKRLLLSFAPLEKIEG